VRRSRPLRGALAAAAIAALALAAVPVTFAAFASRTESSGNEVKAAKDFRAPQVTAAAIGKSAGGAAGFLKQGGEYFVYANVAADTGNPASGIATVRADVAAVTTGATAVALTAGSFSAGGVSYGYRSAALTANPVLAEGARGFTVTATDNALNAAGLGGSVTIDNTAPKASDVQTTNVGGGTNGLAELGDTLVLSFSEPVEAESTRREAPPAAPAPPSGPRSRRPTTAPRTRCRPRPPTSPAPPTRSSEVRALSVLAFLVLAGSATAAVLDGGSEAGARASATAAEGSFGFANSRDGMPIFSAAEIAPGNSVSGTVVVTDTGTEPGELTLAQHDVSDVAGPGGGELSKRLSLRVTDVTAPASPVTVYAGPLAPMPAQKAGRLAPGASRTYEFVATLPESGGAQNDVQEASTSVAYSWTAGEVVAGPEPTPSPSSPGPGPAGSAPVGLRLTITRVQHKISHGRLLVRAGCDRPCAISARGRLRVRSASGRRRVKLSLSRPQRFVAGTQRLSIRVPHQLRHWLRTDPGRLRARVRLVLVARDRAGEIATAKRTLRLHRQRHAGR